MEAVVRMLLHTASSTIPQTGEQAQARSGQGPQFIFAVRLQALPERASSGLKEAAGAVARLQFYLSLER
jgi:hypothetical protein